MQTEKSEDGITREVDSIQQRITEYSSGLSFAQLTPEAVHAAKVRVIDTLGALIGGFFGEPCQLARNLAAKMPCPDGSTIFGTRSKTTPDMAAFVNGTTARYPELADSYHWPGSAHGHASDVIAPLLGVGEYAHASGRDYITSIVAAYEVFCRISDVTRNRRFCNTIFGCLGTAVGAGKMLKLTPEQLSHCISIAIIPNLILRQVRLGQRSMFKGAATGQAGRAGVFAAMVAAEGIDGPHLPFEGNEGWCAHVSQERFTLKTMGGNGVPFKILDTQIKNRPCNGNSIASILAAEKIAPLSNFRDVKEIMVEVYEYAVGHSADPADHPWDPDSREAADHSVPYVVAVTLMDGTVTLRSYNEAHLKNPELRALIQKIKVAANDDFTKAFEEIPPRHYARVTVTMNNGEKIVGNAGGDADDLGVEKTDKQIVQKFRGLAEDYFTARQIDSILDRLWHLEEIADVAEIPPALVMV